MTVRNFLDQTFITHFVEEVKIAYQNMGVGTRSRVRVRNNVVGKTAEFPKVAALGKPMSKAFGEHIPIVEQNWARVTCNLEDRYHGLYIDPRADLVTNVDERRVVVSNIAGAYARYEDELICTAMNQSNNPNNQLASDDAWADETPMIEVMQAFGNSSVFRAGDLYAYVTWGTWGKLLKLNSFVNAEVGGDPALTRNGVAAKMYYGFAILPYELLPVHSGTSRVNLFWQRDAVALAVSGEFELTFHEIPERDVILARAYSRMGSVLIDEAGVIRRRAQA